VKAAESGKEKLFKEPFSGHFVDGDGADFAI